MSSFLDAQQMSKDYPDTFHVPSNQSLTALKSGDCVKICENNERFWVELHEVSGNKLKGRVDNDLVHEHSFKCDDIIEFETKNVMGIY